MIRGSHNKVTLAWIPEHEEHQGNVEANKLAQKGSSMACIESEPYCGVTKSAIKTLLKQWIVK